MDLNAVEAIVPAERGLAWQEGDAFLAGGTWLFSEPQPGVRRLVDLQAFGWPALADREDGLEIAATCTLAELAAWPGPPLLRQCCEALLGSFKVSNLATVGGNLCLALPAGPMSSLTVALDAVCTLWGPDGAREVPAREFVTGVTETVLRPGELLRSVLLPAGALASRTAFRQFSLSPLGRSAVVVIGRRGADGFTLTVTASLPRPAQLRFAAVPGAEELAAALDAATLTYYADVHGDPVWREHLTRMYAEEVRCELCG